MKKLLLIFLLIPQILWAAPPTRQNTYTSQTTIRSADVSANENVIFTYLQNGIDTVADGTIVNADVSSSAAISYPKLNLMNGIVNSDVSSSAAISYSKLNLVSSITSSDIVDGTIVNADINSSAAIVASKLDLTSPGAIGSTAANSGAFSTLKVGTTNQGDILYDNGTSIVRLTPGTSGQVLKTNGASANPSWTTGPASILISNTSISGAATTGNIAITNTKYYKVVFNFQGINNNTLIVRFNGSSDAVYRYIFNGRTTGGAITGGATGATGAIITTAINNATISTSGVLYIFPQNGTDSISFEGKTIYQQETSALLTNLEFAGDWDNNAAATSFSMVTSGGSTFSGNVLLYELSQS